MINTKMIHMEDPKSYILYFLFPLQTSSIPQKQKSTKMSPRKLGLTQTLNLYQFHNTPNIKFLTQGKKIEKRGWTE